MEFPIPAVVYTWEFWCSAVLCYIVCEALKKIPGIQGWAINVVNLAVGAVLYTALTMDWAVPASYLFGMLAASMADIAYQLYKNVVEAAANAALKGEKDD